MPRVALKGLFALMLCALLLAAAVVALIKTADPAGGTARSGRTHSVCVVYRNVGAGTSAAKRCTAVRVPARA